jgi:phosphatidylglycerophosphate synthase
MQITCVYCVGGKINIWLLLLFFFLLLLVVVFSARTIEKGKRSQSNQRLFSVE